MGKILVIAEKPSVAQDYARVLGCRQKGQGYVYNERYMVSWALGHLMELSEPEAYDKAYARWSYQQLPILPEPMKLQVIKGQSSKQFTVLKKLMNSREVDSLICGTDSGREGELIFRYIYQAAGCRKPFRRLWVSSMTTEAITKGFQNLKDGSEYDLLYKSAQCRSQADWLVGINASRAYSVQYNALLSIGRVQTPTLAMIVGRQKEIAEFVPQPYYEIQLTHPWTEQTSTDNSAAEKGGKTFHSRYAKLSDEPDLSKAKVVTTRIPEEIKAQELCRKAREQASARVLCVRRQPRRQFPPRLYDLTELQRDGNRKYGFSASKVLNLAQRLYETHKLLTYPRTDSRYLPEDMKENVRKTLYAINLPEFHDSLAHIPVTADHSLPFTSRIIDNTKITDHHAIIPTMKKPDLSKLTSDERKIYELVCRRLIEVFYPPFEYDDLEVILGVGEDRYVARGRSVRRLGYMMLHTHEKTAKNKTAEQEAEAEDPLPDLREGDLVAIQKAEVVRCETKPPKPFTEATLLTAMEYAGRYVEDELKAEMNKLSLGTPATRAAIIERLLQVGYIERKGKTLLPTSKGTKLISILPSQICSAQLTGRWEKGLDEIYAGTMDPERFMESIKRYVIFLVKEAADRKEVTFDSSESRNAWSRKKNASYRRGRKSGTSASSKTSKTSKTPKTPKTSAHRSSSA